MLAVDGVRKAYDGFRLGPVSLDVDAEVLAVLGPSGCGKTTLLSIVAGLVDPDAGTVRLDGRDLADVPTAARGIGLVFQDGAVFPHMTARENVAYAADPDAVHPLADRLGIVDILDQPAHTLSGGQRQRVALARSIAADPDVLLLDEPLANLDAPIKRRLRAEMRDLLADLDVPVVYVTHDQSQAAAVGDRLAVMGTGEIHQTGPPSSVFARPASPFVADFTGATNVLRATRTRDGLRWGDYPLAAAYDGDSDADAVWVSIRPETIRLAADDGDAAIEGRITRRTYEGDAYRVELQPDAAPDTLTISLPPPRYTDARLDDRDRVAVTVPADAVHVIGPA